MKNLKETFLRLAKDSVIVTASGLVWSAFFAALTYSGAKADFVPVVTGGLIMSAVFAPLSLLSFILYKLWR